MFRCRLCRRRKIKFLVAVVSIIGLVYVTYQVKSIQELTQKTEIMRKPVRGVHYALISQYNGVLGNEFVCLHDRTPIALAKINDDYCDCDDGTDEPGTDACPNGKFYCDSDIYKRHAVPLPSSRVNDGICDCCDGSDEWKKIRLPFKLPDYVQKRIGAYLSPCLYSC